jgi:hypothetical protein
VPLTENQKEWVAALRSGEYKQGRRVLHHGDNFCCLGVGCDLAIKAGVKLEVSTIPGEPTRYGGDRNYTPKEVMEWLGLASKDGVYRIGVGSSSLASMNDDGKSFSQIADVIELQPKGLFTE